MTIYEPIIQKRLAQKPSKGSWVSNISSDSRYANIGITRTMHEESNIPVLLDRSNYFVQNYGIHTVRGSERVDHIAKLYYGDAGLWWRVANANPEHLYPRYTPGTKIRVPI